MIISILGLPTMHDHSSLVAITESFSEEIVRSLATFTSIRIHSFRGSTGNCTHVKRFSSFDITNLLRTLSLIPRRLIHRDVKKQKSFLAIRTNRTFFIRQWNTAIPILG